MHFQAVGLLPLVQISGTVLTAQRERDRHMRCVHRASIAPHVRFYQPFSVQGGRDAVVEGVSTQHQMPPLHLLTNGGCSRPHALPREGCRKSRKKKKCPVWPTDRRSQPPPQKK